MNIRALPICRLRRIVVEALGNDRLHCRPHPRRDLYRLGTGLYGGDSNTEQLRTTPLTSVKGSQQTLVLRFGYSPGSWMGLVSKVEGTVEYHHCIFLPMALRPRNL